MLVDERRHRIAMHVLSQGGATVGELSRVFGVSAVTIRSDLEAMEQMGVLKRNHGGAVANRVARFSPTFQEQTSVNLESKRSIAAAAVRMVEDGDTVLLDAGSTVLFVSRELRDRNVTLVTNSLFVVNEMVNRSHAELMVVGGVLYEPGLCFVGSLAEGFLAGVHVDTVFLGANGVSPQGVWANNASEAGVKRAMVATAERVVVLADASKIGRNSLVSVVGLDRVHALVTDAAAPQDALEEIGQMGLEVVVA